MNATLLLVLFTLFLSVFCLFSDDAETVVMPLGQEEIVSLTQGTPQPFSFTVTPGTDLSVLLQIDNICQGTVAVEYTHLAADSTVQSGEVSMRNLDTTVLLFGVFAESDVGSMTARFVGDEECSLTVMTLATVTAKDEAGNAGEVVFGTDTIHAGIVVPHAKNTLTYVKFDTNGIPDTFIYNLSLVSGGADMPLSILTHGSPFTYSMGIGEADHAFLHIESLMGLENGLAEGDIDPTHVHISFHVTTMQVVTEFGTVTGTLEAGGDSDAVFTGYKASDTKTLLFGFTPATAPTTGTDITLCLRTTPWTDPQCPPAAECDSGHSVVRLNAGMEAISVQMRPSGSDRVHDLFVHVHNTGEEALSFAISVESTPHENKQALYVILGVAGGLVFVGVLAWVIYLCVHRRAGKTGSDYAPLLNGEGSASTE